jgi:hypothetical protein
MEYKFHKRIPANYVGLGFKGYLQIKNIKPDRMTIKLHKRIPAHHVGLAL